MLCRTCVVLVASLGLAGCNLTNKEEAQHDDSTNPHYRQAQQDLEDNNPKAAINDYEEALAADSKLPGAHYELGLIYGDKLGDPVSSIYHFKRYLDLAPDSDKSGEVRTLIDKQSQAFAASLPNSPAQSADDYAKLQADNASLQKQVNDAAHTIAQLQNQLAHAGRHHGRTTMLAATVTTPTVTHVSTAAASDTATTASTPSGPSPTNAVAAAETPADTNAAPASPPRAVAVDTNSPDVNAAPPTPTTPGATNAAPSGPARSYTVVKGDSIWKIAKKMYPGDTKNGEDKILSANPGLNPKRLKIGQVLVVP